MRGVKRVVGGRNGLLREKAVGNKNRAVRRRRVAEKDVRNNEVSGTLYPKL